MLPGSTAAPSGFAGLNDKRPPATKYNRSLWSRLGWAGFNGERQRLFPSRDQRER